MFARAIFQAYHMGIRNQAALNTLANATRDRRIYCELAQSLIATARWLYATEPFGLDLKETVYALDATTIDLCLSVFPWAPFRAAKAIHPVYVNSPRLDLDLSSRRLMHTYSGLLCSY